MNISGRYTIEQLEQRGVQVRKNALKQQLQALLPLLGMPQSEQQLIADWQSHWQHASVILQRGLAWSLQQLAAYYAEHTIDLMTASSASQSSSSPIWDAWAQSHLDNALNEFVYQIHQAGLPSALFKRRLVGIREQALLLTRSEIELAARQALAKPGNGLQRGFLKVMHVCEIVLPLAAMTWVSYRVFMGYYNSNAYLGVDFAVHSVLLIALTWLIPFFIAKKAQPSLQQSALRGVNKGLQNALQMIDNEVLTVIRGLHRQHAEQIQQLDELIALCDTQSSTVIDNNSPLTRMLINWHPPRP